MTRQSKYAVNWELSLVKKEKLKKWAIYLHYDRNDGRVYAGKTSIKPIEHRFAIGALLRDGGGYRGRFHQYLETHPLEDMIHVVIDTTDDDLKAKELEEAYTELFCATDERYGFNSQYGDVPSEKAQEAVKESWKEGGACREAICKYWYTIRHPHGEITETDNLNAFCKEYGINRGSLASRGHSKGYTLISQEPKQRDNIVKSL